MQVHEKMRVRQRIRRKRKEELDIIDKYEEEKEAFDIQQSKAFGEYI